MLVVGKTCSPKRFSVDHKNVCVCLTKLQTTQKKENKFSHSNKCLSQILLLITLCIQEIIEFCQLIFRFRLFCAHFQVIGTKPKKKRHIAKKIGWKFHFSNLLFVSISGGTFVRKVVQK